MWPNPRGWELLSGCRPDTVALRKEVLRQLEIVPEPHRTAWKTRLRSKRNDPHFSVRLETFLHHFFKERNWEIEIEPDMPNTRNKPDFLLRKGNINILVEAKTMLDPLYVDQQESRLMDLAKGLSRKLNRTISMHPRIDLPPSLPNRRIAAEIEQRASNAEPVHEFHVEGEHQGAPYALDVVVILQRKPTPTAGVGATISQVYEVEPGHRMRESIQGKASKYGMIDVPYIIAFWPQSSLHFSYRDENDDDDDFEALYGDKVLGGHNLGEMKPALKPNGLFTMANENRDPRYRQVSAVAVCYLDENSVRLYHNPYAKHAVDKTIFKGIPQKLVDRTTGKHWWA